MDSLARTIGRRTAAEIGAIRKDHGGRLRVCLVYPNRYFVGMSSLGYQAVYHLLNSDPRIVCERAFVLDAEDLEGLRRTGSAIVSYESQTALNQFDVIAFSISYELDYIGVPRVLRLAKVPVMASERGEEHPLVMAGGAAVSINPEPLAGLVDVFVIGEAEEALGRLTDGVREWRKALEGAGEVPGVYLPGAVGGGQERLACPSASLRVDSDMPAPQGVCAAAQVARQHVSDLEAWPTHSRLLARETEFGGLFLVEVSRGCGRGCKFCVTRACYWPLRWRSVASVIRSAREGLGHRDAIGLVGAAVSDHPEIDEIARRIVGLRARLSVSSLRADSVSETLLGALARSGARSVTIAPEAGSERLRREIGKGIPDAQIIDALKRACAVGMREAKLYFMVGLPGEEEEDVAAIPALVRKCIKAAGLSRVTVAAGAFVPKPNTPYEGEGMLPVRELSRRLRAIRDELRRERRVKLALESPNWSYIEGALSRGDRRLGEVIVAAEAEGGSLSAWRKAFAEEGLSCEEFAGPGGGARRPWGFIS